MREIKFRGKSKKDGKWLYGYLGESKFKILNTEYSEKVIFDNVWSFNSDNCAFIVKDLAVYPHTIGQFTGLKDENSKELYEDDIIEINYKYEYQSLQGAIPDQDCFCVGVVTWMPDSLRFMIRLIKAEFPLNKEFEDAESVYVPFEIFDLDEIKILGNIYDNMELL